MLRFSDVNWSTFGKPNNLSSWVASWLGLVFVLWLIYLAVGFKPWMLVIPLVQIVHFKFSWLTRNED
ncbi:hypothetical protein RUE5091_02417 [Ruegeria denitrificans]|uniref:Uncharacterized protein n=1 Tax=Ruegeria denitrificans TaxID=1715692 RepID=A0A0P1IIA5_9RHOB|nr:hypothetical protein RUE5091_02417 [Ruegeria denitrificans]